MIEDISIQTAFSLKPMSGSERRIAVQTPTGSRAADVITKLNNDVAEYPPRSVAASRTRAKCNTRRKIAAGYSPEVASLYDMKCTCAGRIETAKPLCLLHRK